MRLGRCVDRFDAPSGDVQQVVAVVAGPDWDVVKRRDADWSTETQIQWGAIAGVLFALSALEVALLYVGLGLPTTVAISLTTVLGSLWLPAPAVLCCLLLLPLGVASERGGSWAAGSWDGGSRASSSPGRACWRRS